MRQFRHRRTFREKLADEHGLYKTIGWTYDTHALRKDALSEDAFMEDVRQTMAWHETITLEQLEHDDFDLLIAAWTATDRVAHMFWRFLDPKHPMYDAEKAKKYGDAVAETYRAMDAIVGKAAAKLGPDDLFIVLSDHGSALFDGDSI